MEEPRYNEVCVDDRICPSDLKCAICHSIYVSPVMLLCGHSFCTLCAKNWLQKRHNCPTCRNPSSGNPIKNIALGQIVEEHNRILAEQGPIPSDPAGSDDSDNDQLNASGVSLTPTETFVRCHEVRLSKRTRKNSNNTQIRRLHSTSDSSPARFRIDSPVFARTNTVRFAASLDRTPLHVLAARKRMERPLYPDEYQAGSASPVTSRFERNPRARPRGETSPSSRYSDNTSTMAAPVSPAAAEMKRGGVLRRSLGLLRKSVRLLRRDSNKSVRKDSIEELKEEENEKFVQEQQQQQLGGRNSFRRKSLRKSFIRAIRGIKHVKGNTVGAAAAAGPAASAAAAASEDAAARAEGPRLVSTARILVIDSTANLQLAAFIRSLSSLPPHSIEGIRVLSSEERREMPLLMEEYEGLEMVSVVFNDGSDENKLVLYDIYEGRREMHGEVEHCTLLLKCCHAVLLFFAADPSSALQATSDCRYVQKERKEIGMPLLPMWTVHATLPQDSPPARGRSGSTSSGGGGQAQARSLSLAQANRLSTSELSTRLLPGQQKHLQLTAPPKEEFVQGIRELLVDLMSTAVSLE